VSTVVLHHSPVRADTAVAVRAPQPRLRITRRGRAVVAGLVAAPLVVAALVVGLNGGAAVANDGAPAQIERVVVEPGQTLWGLAEQLAPSADPREVVAEVLAFNGLEAAGDVQAGQELALPPVYTR
jgi:hypothetical protein